jgi:hypothetical protein
MGSAAAGHPWGGLAWLERQRRGCRCLPVGGPNPMRSSLERSRMTLRFASFNIENLFARPRATQPTWAQVRPILDMFAACNSLIELPHDRPQPQRPDRQPGRGPSERSRFTS